MNIDSSLTDKRVVGEICESSNEKKSKKSAKKRNKNKQKTKVAKANVVQKLYETCKDVFENGGAGFVPPPADILRLQSVLDSMKPEDVNLTPQMSYFRSSENVAAPRVTYLHLYECDKFSIGIFCIPTRGVIPLHNHPGMTVFSKILFGSMHIKSYDWVADDIPGTIKGKTSLHPYSRSLGLAKVHVDSDFTAPCSASILYPAAGGNMHRFEALTPCAVLDVLGPPYSEPDGRHCTYYHDFPYTKFPGAAEFPSEEDMKRYAWLQERQKPEEFVVVGGTYKGPVIVDR